MTDSANSSNAGARRNTVKVSILGDDYTLRSEASPEETRAIAQYVDKAIREILQAGVAVETHRAAILACLRVAGELFEAQRQWQQASTAVQELSDEIRPWLPPAKRYD